MIPRVVSRRDWFHDEHPAAGLCVLSTHHSAELNAMHHVSLNYPKLALIFLLSCSSRVAAYHEKLCFPHLTSQGTCQTRTVKSLISTPSDGSMLCGHCREDVSLLCIFGGLAWSWISLLPLFVTLPGSCATRILFIRFVFRLCKIDLTCSVLEPVQNNRLCFHWQSPITGAFVQSTFVCSLWEQCSRFKKSLQWRKN